MVPIGEDDGAEVGVVVGGAGAVDDNGAYYLRIVRISWFDRKKEAYAIAVLERVVRVVPSGAVLCGLPCIGV